MASFSTNVEGLSEMKKTLSTLSVEIEKKLVQQATRAGLRVIRDAAKERLPAGYGELKSSFKISKIKRSEAYGTVRYKLRAGGKRAFYAHITEFGSGSFYSGKGTRSKRRPYAIKPRGEMVKIGRTLVKRTGKVHEFLRVNGGAFVKQVIHPGVRATPYMRPAFDQANGAALKEYAAVLRKGIERVVRKMARAK